MFIFFISGCVQDGTAIRRASNKINTRNKTNSMGAFLFAIRFNRFYNDCICKLSNTPCMYVCDE